MAMTDEELLLQMKILTEKTDSTTNPNMVFKTSKILNKGLNPEYYSSNNTKIVNILNDLFAADQKTTEVANVVSNKINSILKDTDTSDGQAAWEKLQGAMGQATIIDGLNDLYEGKQAAKVLGLTADDIDKILTVGQDDQGNLVLKAVEQIAGGSTEVKVEEIAYENRYVSSINNVKGALDYVINAVVNDGIEGGLGGGTIVGEITWDMIDDRPTEIADNLLLTGTHLELKDGDTVISSVPLVQDSEIDAMIDNLNVEEQN